MVVQPWDNLQLIQSSRLLFVGAALIRMGSAAVYCRSLVLKHDPRCVPHFLRQCLWVWWINDDGAYKKPTTMMMGCPRVVTIDWWLAYWPTIVGHPHNKPRVELQPMTHDEITQSSFVILWPLKSHQWCLPQKPLVKDMRFNTNH